MATSNSSDKLIKYRYLLTLALAQVQAIEARDQKKLNEIIQQKWAIINSLSGTKDLLKAEPELAGIIKRIQEADSAAERKLSSKMTQVRSKLVEINRQKSAKQAYAHIAKKKHPILGLALEDSTPRYFDIQS